MSPISVHHQAKSTSPIAAEVGKWLASPPLFAANGPSTTTKAHLTGQAGFAAMVFLTVVRLEAMATQNCENTRSTPLSGGRGV
jgi:hypothetical protein